MMDYKWEDHIVNDASGDLVVLSAGHGWNTAGKRSTHDFGEFREYLYNRSIVQWTSEYLYQGRINHVVLVPEMEDIPINSGADNRVKRIAEVKSRYSDWKLFGVDVHGNAAGVEQANGYEVFTSPGRNKSDEIAKIFFDDAKSLGLRMRTDYTDGDPDKEARFGMLVRPNIWMVLVEIGFYSNREEAMRMLTPEFQQEAGAVIAGSIDATFRGVGL